MITYLLIYTYCQFPNICQPYTHSSFAGENAKEICEKVASSQKAFWDERKITFGELKCMKTK